MNVGDKVIKDFSIGDIYVANGISPVLILPTGYHTNLYYIGGFLGLQSWSNQSGSTKKQMLDYLNENNFNFSRNINGEIIKSLKFCEDSFKNNLKKNKEVEKVVEKIAENHPIHKNSCPKGFFILGDGDKIQKGDYVIHGVQSKEKWSEIENYSSVSNSTGKTVKSAKQEWAHLDSIQWIRNNNHIVIPDGYKELDKNDTVVSTNLYEFSDTFANNWTKVNVSIGKKYSELKKADPSIVVIKETD